MKKNPWWKRELKEMLSIASVFFVIFVLFMLMKKAFQNEYTFNFVVIGTAFVGSLIIAKVVLIFDLLPITKRSDHLPNIYRVFFRSLVYLVGYVIFTFLEHLIKGLIEGGDFLHASSLAFHELGKLTYITSLIAIFVAFLFFNAFWVIRAKYGPTALFNLFFRKVDQV
jgi:hypothetical protein